MTRKAPVVFNPSYLSKMKDFARLQAVTCTLQWLTGSCHFQWPWITLKVIRLLQGFSNSILRIFFSNISHGFNWHGASRGTSATAEFLVLFTVVCDIIKFLPREAHASDIQSTFMLCLDLRRSFALSATHRCCIRHKSIVRYFFQLFWFCVPHLTGQPSGLQRGLIEFFYSVVINNVSSTPETNLPCLANGLLFFRRVDSVKTRFRLLYLFCIVFFFLLLECMYNYELCALFINLR